MKKLLIIKYLEEISSEIIKAKELMLYCETILRDIEKEISLDNK